jgi:Cytidylyltransferase-like
LISILVNPKTYNLHTIPFPTMEEPAPDSTRAEPASRLASGPAPEPTPESSADGHTYSFPHSRLKKVMNESSKTPLCLVACGSFSPITYLHLRMFEMAADYVKFNTDFEIVGGYLSPVSDAYKKAGLASAEHRLARLPPHPSSSTADKD